MPSMLPPFRRPILESSRRSADEGNSLSEQYTGERGPGIPPETRAALIPGTRVSVALLVFGRSIEQAR
jgi:hypothetical protein